MPETTLGSLKPGDATMSPPPNSNWADKVVAWLKGFFDGMDKIGAALMGNRFINAIWHGFLGGVGMSVLSCVSYSAETGIQIVQPITIHLLWMGGVGGVVGILVGFFRGTATK